jgi:hypothetical protein
VEWFLRGYAFHAPPAGRRHCRTTFSIEGRGSMKRLVFVTVGFLVLAAPWSVAIAGGDHDGPGTKKAAHSLFCDCSTPPDTHLVCGTTKANKPYTLNIAATASGGPGGFTIVFRDGDTMGFSVPDGSSFSTSQSLGGVPNVDTPSVMIVPSGEVHSMMASVAAHDGKAFCTHCTGGVSGSTGTAGAGDPAVCNFP